MLTKQSSWGQKRPLKCLKLEADIRGKMETKANKHLEISNIKEMGLKYGIMDEEIGHFLHFRHAMGEFVHFPDKGLEHIVITNTRWLVDKLKALISPLEFLECKKLHPQIEQQLKQGRISEKNLHEIWEGEDVLFLIELMKKFDLLIPFVESDDMPENCESSEDDEQIEWRDTHYLVSCILPHLKQHIYEKKCFKDCKMMKVYSATHTSDDLLPVGTFHKFISRCSKMMKWELCTINHLKNTGVYFDVQTCSYGMRLAIILLSYLEKTTIETSVWLKKGALNRDTIGQDVVHNIITIRYILEDELRALSIESSAEFKLLCPNYHCDCDYECLETLVEYKALESEKTTFNSQQKKCVTTGEPWRLSTYQETKFCK